MRGPRAQKNPRRLYKQLNSDSRATGSQAIPKQAAADNSHCINQGQVMLAEEMPMKKTRYAEEQIKFALKHAEYLARRLQPLTKLFGCAWQCSQPNLISWLNS